MRDDPGFFDIDGRLEELSAKGDDLERLKGIVEKTCSTKARTFDFLPLALAMASGIGLALGFLRWIF